MSDRISVYEAMFLINQSEAADFNGAIAHIEEILHRGQAELVSMRKWDERRLAYEIDKQRRGVYILTYFRAPTKSVAHIERDCNLSERIMRVLILSAEHLTDEEIASQNDREGLKVEARLRAERAADAASRTPEPEPVDAE
jgi:small subunit ribosomal protein S6